jgi:hypothetical protein
MNEKQYLSELAKKYLELANLPVMEERQELWCKHNDGDKNYTPIIMEMDTFYKDLLPTLKCEDPFYVEIEEILLREIIRYEFVGDDKVISPYLALPIIIDYKQFDIKMEQEFAGNIGYHIEPYIKDINTDLGKLKSSKYSYNSKLNQGRLEKASEILPAKFVNTNLYWPIMHSKVVVDLMGMENFFMTMVDEPEMVHKLFSFIATDTENFLKWQEKEKILTTNTWNHYAGSGSYGFTNELSDEPILKQMWGNMNSQESVGLSASMFGEFIFPYYNQMADMFGRVYWGCCEPVHDVWDDYISKINNLSKVSISAWCDEKIMGEKLANSKVIYSRKPSPNFVGVPDIFDEKAFYEHIKTTLDSARDCNIEFIMRDVYTLKGDKTRAKKAVDIVRGLVNNR